MKDPMRISDKEAYDRLHAAMQEIGEPETETIYAGTALKAAREVLTKLQLGLVALMEKNGT